MCSSDLAHLLSVHPRPGQSRMDHSGDFGTTVCVMCPLMSLVATLLFKHPGNQIAAVWLQTFAVNFPMALCFQLFFCGPFVRMLFRRIFAGQLAADADRA